MIDPIKRELVRKQAEELQSKIRAHVSTLFSREEILIHELFKQCKSLKKQRDELINDMQEVKRKAEAFDELKSIEHHISAVREIAFYHSSEEPFNEGMFSVYHLTGEILDKLNLERGSDE